MFHLINFQCTVVCGVHPVFDITQFSTIFFNFLVRTFTKSVTITFVNGKHLNFMKSVKYFNEIFVDYREVFSDSLKLYFTKIMWNKVYSF